jgi:hypothetical protein
LLLRYSPLSRLSRCYSPPCLTEEVGRLYTLLAGGSLYVVNGIERLVNVDIAVLGDGGTLAADLRDRLAPNGW